MSTKKTDQELIAEGITRTLLAEQNFETSSDYKDALSKAIDDGAELPDRELHAQIAHHSQKLKENPLLSMSSNHPDYQERWAERARHLGAHAGYVHVYDNRKFQKAHDAAMNDKFYDGE